MKPHPECKYCGWVTCRSIVDLWGYHFGHYTIL